MPLIATRGDRRAKVYKRDNNYQVRCEELKGDEWKWVRTHATKNLEIVRVLVRYWLSKKEPEQPYGPPRD